MFSAVRQVSIEETRWPKCFSDWQNTNREAGLIVVNSTCGSGRSVEPQNLDAILVCKMNSFWMAVEIAGSIANFTGT
ncbi:unannotated protein [freshwater metagenome]|uniref:Unannotated protein n=1 Tax=freshwater metagenome TaxID=449393 RepID=A0A6J6CCY8_9ZZZZ